MKKILIYMKVPCPFCDMAKKLLFSKGITEIEYKNITDSDTIAKEMYTVTNRKTVPQIFIGSFHVGGFDDLAKLDSEGQLDLLLKE